MRNRSGALFYNGCGVHVDGHIACWSGDEELNPSVSRTFTDLSGTGRYGCGLRTDGRLVCWDGVSRGDTVRLAFPPY